MFLAAGLLALTGCQKNTDQNAAPEATPPPAPEATPAPVVATPKPVAVATPAPNYFAPEGVFYLTAKVSLETSDGITGYPPGTMVTKAADGRYKLADGQFAALEANQITNDLRIARQLMGADRAAQAALSQAGNRTAADIAAAQTQSAIAAAAAATPAPPPVSRGGAPAPAGPLNSSGLGATHGYTKRFTDRP